jgi:flagellar secretion chaperone FliS
MTGINAYRDSTVATADPVKLITLLYDGTLKAIRKARLLREDGNRTAYLDQLEKANLILGELFASLDMSQGSIPSQLGGLYTYCMRLLVEASFDDPSNLDEVEKHISRVAESWRSATAGLHSPEASRSYGAVA